MVSIWTSIWLKDLSLLRKENIVGKEKNAYDSTFSSSKKVFKIPGLPDCSNPGL